MKSPARLGDSTPRTLRSIGAALIEPMARTLAAATDTGSCDRLALVRVRSSGELAHPAGTVIAPDEDAPEGEMP